MKFNNINDLNSANIIIFNSKGFLKVKVDKFNQKIYQLRYLGDEEVRDVTKEIEDVAMQYTLGNSPCTMGVFLYLVLCNEVDMEHIRFVKFWDSISLRIGARTKEYSKMYYIKNRERIRQQQKEYVESAKERRKESRKKYYEENRERIQQQQKDHYERRKDHYKEYRKKYYEENREIILNQKKEYYGRTREQRKEYLQGRKKNCK